MTVASQGFVAPCTPWGIPGRWRTSGQAFCWFDMDIPPILNRRVVSENRFLRYVEEDLPDRHGRPYTYYQVEAHHDAVIVVPVLPDGRLVVERIYRHPYRRWFLEFPAGGIEPGEDPLVAAARELGEETGYVASAVEPMVTMEAMPGLLRMRLHYVVAYGCQPGATVQLEALEMLKVELMDGAAVQAAVAAGDVSSFLAMGWMALQSHQAGVRAVPPYLPR